MINFNVPPYVGDEIIYIKDAIKERKLCGDGKYTKLCDAWIEEQMNAKKSLLTTSCTHALEMAAMLCQIESGDEVIMPSFTFVSTADAFALRGAKIVFVDIRPDTMNIDENEIENAITRKTKVIVPVHYAGVGCEMDKIMSIAKKHNLYVVEDSAQGVMSKYKGKALGTIGDIGCYSFHETKNYTMGEGGAILLNDEKYVENAEIIREKGTNRSRFFRGQVDKYSWVELGSSYLPSELNAAYLWAQLLKAEEINDNRKNIWERYFAELSEIEKEGKITLPVIPNECTHNAHMFYIKTNGLGERTKLIDYLKKNDVLAVFHYVPLHSSPAGIKYGEFRGIDRYTTKESDKLVRLPLYYGITDQDQSKVISLVKKFYQG